MYLWDITDGIPEPLTQAQQAIALRLHFFFCNSSRFAQTNNLMCRQSARAHTTLVSPAVHLRFNSDSWLSAHIKRPNTFGSIHFMR